VGDKNSNLDVSDIYCISKESLDMMIADKKAEEKSAHCPTLKFLPLS
jgi:hypothetical protein